MIIWGALSRDIQHANSASPPKSSEMARVRDAVHHSYQARETEDVALFFSIIMEKLCSRDIGSNSDIFRVEEEQKKRCRSCGYQSESVWGFAYFRAINISDGESPFYNPFCSEPSQENCPECANTKLDFTSYFRYGDKVVFKVQRSSWNSLGNRPEYCNEVLRVPMEICFSQTDRRRETMDIIPRCS